MLRRLVLVLSLTVAAPALGFGQESVTCKDGTLGKPGRGACSHHGGIAKSAAAPSASPTSAPPLAPGPAVPPPAHGPAARGPVKAPLAGQPTARCKDGTTSYSQHHTGACSHHGGVAQWL
jgi:hypothetical protein